MSTIPYPDVDVMDDIWGTDAHLWGPDVATLGLDDEVEDIELGDRVSWWITMCLLGGVYSTERDRIRGAVSNLVSAVALATSRRGLPFPPEWWPPSVVRE